MKEAHMKRDFVGRLTLVAVVLIAACSEPMAPFNEVEKFRVLTLVAEPPSLAETEIAQISALLAAPDQDLSKVTYKWSWCPIAVNASDGGNCAVTEDQFKAIAEQLVLQSANEQVAQLLDSVPITFDLGTGAAAQFVYALPSSFLADVCKQLIADSTLGLSGILDCTDKLDVVVRMEATLGGETVVAVKNIPLYIDATRADNENPTISGLHVLDSSGDEVAFENDTAVLYRGETLDLEAQIDDSSSQEFLPKTTTDNPNPSSAEESMFMTWYVTGGETDSIRTTYIENEVSMDVLRRNSFTVPNAADFPGTEIDLYLVLEDERGGSGWLERRFHIEER
jgi:hypothetical protein